DGEPALEVLRWGLKADGKPFNIRDDSADKPWARTLLKTRVVFPLSGFYEWQAQESGPKRPHLFVPAQDAWLAIVGVLGMWDGPAVSMMTTSSNQFMTPYHHPHAGAARPGRGEGLAQAVLEARGGPRAAAAGGGRHAPGARGLAGSEQQPQRRAQPDRPGAELGLTPR